MTQQDGNQENVNKTFDFHNMAKSIEVQVDEEDIQQSFSMKTKGN